ncbi:MAG: alpha-amylase [Clostridiaceae bacterium]|nr:alpha-amylase [Clostridiaceae bacterium]
MDNYVMIQFFEWYLPDDGKHWNRLKAEAKHLASLGVSGVWIPPPTKGSGTGSVGYNIYDLYDLGEFDQKGSVRTKYGTKEELKEAIEILHQNGLKVYADVVLNHKAGADETERFKVVEVNPSDRTKIISEPFEIDGWTKFNFPGRADKYSSFKWNYTYFVATDKDDSTGREGIFKIIADGKDWSDNVDSENGNYDYLMFADIDYNNESVINEVKQWSLWFVKELNLDGFRLDAIKHIDEKFMRDFVNNVRVSTSKDFYVIGEYWNVEVAKLEKYLDDVDYNLNLFDVTLHYNFFEASKKGRDYDLSKILENTLVSLNPLNVVTLVDNHDSQKGQSLESCVEDWFKIIAYAIILLRKDGYPCIFYGDYYGIQGENPMPGKKELLDPLLIARKNFSYGEQIDYFDHPNVIGWIRKGDEEHKESGIAVVISNGEDGIKNMCFGKEVAGKSFYDITGNRKEIITLNEDGAANFTVQGGSVSVWVIKKE